MAAESDLSPGMVEQLALREAGREEASSKPPRARTQRAKEPTETEIAKLKAWGWTRHRTKGYWVDSLNPKWKRGWGDALAIIAKDEARGDLPGNVAPSRPAVPSAASEVLDAITPIRAPDDAYTAVDGGLFGAVPAVAPAVAPAPLDTLAVEQAVPAVDTSDYERFIAAKRAVAPERGFEPGPISEKLFPFQRDIVRWAVRKGCAAIFAAFGLGKTWMQLEAGRLVCEHTGGRFLIVAPLGVRGEFKRDAEAMGLTITFIRRIEEAGRTGLYLTNYETVRDGKLDPRLFDGASLDEASCLRAFGGSKTFREFMALFAGDDRRAEHGPTHTAGVRYRFVATATPSPNDIIELLAYAAFLGVMDVSAAKTRWFDRDSEQADNLTLRPSKAREFWLWVASWALFVTKPSDLGYSDEGYALPEMQVIWHEVPSDHTHAGVEKSGQGRLLRDTSLGVVDASREKRESLGARLAKMLELRALDPAAHRILWHDLEPEREAIEAACPGVRSVYGTQDMDEREASIVDFSEGRCAELATKPVLCGSGCNFQRHCAWAIYLGIGFKFNDFAQSLHRLQRFQQPKQVRVDIIYTEAERSVRETLLAKWQEHNALVAQMTAIVREYGLSRCAMHEELADATTVERFEVQTEHCTLVNNDSVLETQRMAPNSVKLIVTSVPFGNQYKYSSSLYDMGHTEDAGHFFRQMDYLTPGLLRVLEPGRVLAVHVKDRIVPGGLTGLGFQTLYPFHLDCVTHYQKHGFALVGIITVVTDVVRENNQTYRLAYTEQCKDGSRQGVGVPEYILLFRKPQTDQSKGYADVPVVKEKSAYKLSRWQIDAAGFWSSSGNRLLSSDDFRGLTHAQIFKLFRRHNLAHTYDYEHHVALNEALETRGALPVDFSLLQPQSKSEHVWSDVTRMRTLNCNQAIEGKDQHLCPLQLDIVDRLITRFSMKGETVLDPFGGLMTVPVRATMLGRRGVGIELSPVYFADGVAHVREAERKASLPMLFDLDAAERDEEPFDLPAASGG